MICLTRLRVRKHVCPTWASCFSLKERCQVDEFTHSIPEFSCQSIPKPLISVFFVQHRPMPASKKSSVAASKASTATPCVVWSSFTNLCTYKHRRSRPRGRPPGKKNCKILRIHRRRGRRTVCIYVFVYGFSVTDRFDTINFSGLLRRRMTTWKVLRARLGSLSLSFPSSILHNIWRLTIYY